MRVRSGLIAGIGLTLFAWGAIAGDAEPPAVKPPNESQVRQLIEDLGSEDFARREKAHRELLRIGEPAWPFLRKHLQDPDRERQARVRALAESMALPTDEESVRAQRFIAQLENDDEELRAKGLDGLVAMGPVGLRILKKHLSSQDANPRLEVELPKQIWFLGEVLTCSALVRNHGSGTYWQNKRRPNTILLLMEHRSCFGDERTRGRRRRAVFRYGGMASTGYRNPIRDWKPVLSGAVIQEEGLQRELRWPGVYDVTVRYTPTSSSTIRPRFPGTTRTVELELQQPDRKALEKRETVFVLPDLKHLPADPELSLQLRTVAEAATKHKPAAAFPVRIALRAPKLDVPILLEAGFKSHAWFAWIDHAGKPVKWGSWASAMKPAERPLDPIEIRPDSELTCRLDLECPSKPGRYALMAYYNAEIGMLTDEFDFGAEADSEKVVLFEEGELGAIVRDIEIVWEPE